MATQFRASKNRGQDREGWCATFRHPLRADEDGNPLRIRRGLGTTSEAEADRLVEELNRLLSDETFWSLSAKERASRELDPRVVKIFYAGIEVKVADPWGVREEVIRLPGREDGYARVLVVGATGAGKTTLLRQLIGTDPNKERFPSISTAKTTIFDTEIVLEEDGPYRAVVSFLPKDRVRSYVEECVSAAVSAIVSRQSEDVVLRRFMEHHEQRFRLSYLLGSFNPGRSAVRPSKEEADDSDGSDEAESEERDTEIPEVTDADRTRFQERLRDFMSQAQKLAKTVGPDVAERLGVDPTNLKPDDRDAFLSLVEDAIAERADARSLVDEIVSEIQSRFQLLEAGEFDLDRNGWPSTWTFETTDRASFVKTINRFSSNYAPNFGKLYAPVVQGLRAAGPFKPSWIEDKSATPFVFIDGEGLGHTPSSASTLPTSITKRYDQVDVILLVDSATQPMQAAAQAVLRSVAAGGHDSKLAIVFTHFDQVKGDNLPDVKARKGHVTGSLESAVRAVEEAIGGGAGLRLRRRIEDRVVFASNIHDIISKQNKLTRESLSQLVDLFRQSVVPVKVKEAIPVYDLGNLVLAIERAAAQFHETWNARLGLASKPGLTAEHWTRVKALSKRFAYQWEDQYDSLRPVADLIKFVSERLAAFLASPRAWEPSNCAEASREAAVDRVSREVYARLHKLVENRLFQDHVKDWLDAFNHKGTGSTRPRAVGIREIFEAAAPIPAEVPGQASSKLLDAFRDLLRDAAVTAQAKIVS